MPPRIDVPQLKGLYGEKEILEIADAAIKLAMGKSSGLSLVGLSVAILAIFADGELSGIPINGEHRAAVEALGALVASYIDAAPELSLEFGQARES